MLICGVDEAGRGPCLGPMVMAVTTIRVDDEEKLRELGVKDSKLINPKERDFLYEKIKPLVCEYGFLKISAKEIDDLRTFKSLNEIEAMKIGALLNSLKEKPALVYVDSPDPISDNFSRRIEKYLSFKTKLKSEHKADFNYPIVSAASIIAKVERDNEIKSLSKKYGPIGSGYPGDDNTINFIKSWLDKNNDLPDIVRRSWDTTERLLCEKYQTKLF